jgi:hypothetical protein
MRCQSLPGLSLFNLHNCDCPGRSLGCLKSILATVTHIRRTYFSPMCRILRVRPSFGRYQVTVTRVLVAVDGSLIGALTATR